MNDIQKILLISLSALAGLLVLYFLFILIFYLAINHIFTRRQDGNPRLKYFTVDEFRDLSIEKLQLKSGQNQLDGVRIAPLEKEDQQRLIIFFHGLGAGYEAYMREIRQLTLVTKVPVIAFSLSGAGQSTGKKFPNFFKAIDEASLIIHEMIKTYGENREIYLIGHSLGGFIVSNVLSLHPELAINGIIGISAPNNFVDVYTHLLRAKSLTKLFLAFFFHLHFGKKAKITTAYSLKKNAVKTTLIHGTRDQVVPYPNSGQIYADLSHNYPHIRVISLSGRGHNPYLTKESEQALQEVLRLDQVFARDKKQQEEAKKFYQSINYEEIGQIDEELLTAINQIIKGVQS